MWYLIDLKEYFFHRNQFEALISKTRLSPFLPLLTNAEKRFFNDLHITMLCITEVLPAKLVNLNFEILGIAEKGEVSKVLKIVLKYEQMMDADEWFWLKADSLLLHFSTYIFLSFLKVLDLIGNLKFRAKI